MWIHTIFFISHSELETEKILTNRELLEIMCMIYRNFVVCGSLKRIPPKSLTVINRLQAKVFKSLKCLLWIERDYIIRDYVRDNREFKIYDAAGSTTRSEFQLKNER